MRHLVGTQGSGIVATHLVDTGAQGCRAVKLAYDNIGIGGETALEVGTYGGYEDEEQVFLGGMHTHLSTGTYHEGTDVEACTALVGRDETLVEAHHTVHHLVELLSGEFGHQYATACALQTGSILVGAEHTHLAIGTTVGLQALESLLAIVQTGGRHVHGDGLLATVLYLAPSAVAIVATHVVIRFHVAKRKATPIYFVHSFIRFCAQIYTILL